MMRCFLLTAILTMSFIHIAHSETVPGTRTFPGEEMSIYGYLDSRTTANFYTDNGTISGSDVGETLYLRLKGDWSPEERVDVHIEASYLAALGNANSVAVMVDYGILPFHPSTAYPYEDFTQTLALDHAWASVALGPADIAFGKLPIGWGTGYVFNPTARTSSGAALDTVTEETPGVVAIMPSLSLFGGLSLEGYLAFQERSMKRTPLLTDGDWRNLPFGLRARAIAGPFDLSLGYIKEVTDTTGAGTYDRRHFIAADLSGYVWEFGVYAEAALEVGTLVSDSFDAWQSLEFCAGFDWIVPYVGVSIRGEYYHQGGGETDTALYDPARHLAGKLLAEDYLFAYLERTFFDYLSVTVSGFANLDDGSYILMPALSYDVYADFQVSLGATFYGGRESSEFAGEHSIVPGQPAVDLTVPQVVVGCKAGF